jgi:hypothetical protein
MAMPQLRRKNGVRAQKPRNRLPVAKKHARPTASFATFSTIIALRALSFGGALTNRTAQPVSGI